MKSKPKPTPCLCAHPAHPGARCPRRSCGCSSHRPDPRPASERTEPVLSLDEALKRLMPGETDSGAA